MTIILPSPDPTLGLNLGQMVDEVKAKIRNNTIDDLIINWINFVIFNLASNIEFPFLHAIDSFNTESGRRNYPLRTDMQWMKMIWITGQWPPLISSDESQLGLADPFFLTTQGKTTHYVLHDRSIDLWRVPSGVKVANYTLQRRPVKLVNLIDVPDFPYEWHPVIIQGAKVHGYEHERNPLLEAAEAKFRSMVKEQMKSVYYRPDTYHVFRAPINISRPPYPTLPPNFPRAW